MPRPARVRGARGFAAMLDGVEIAVAAAMDPAFRAGHDLRRGGPVDFQSSAVRLWWANRTLTFSAPVEVQVTAVPRGWVAQVSAVSRDDFWALVALGGPFQFHFKDGSVFDVGVGDPDDFGVFPIWGWEEVGDHRRPCPDCSGDLVRTEAVIGADEVTLHDACSGCGRGFVRTLSLPS